MMKSTFSMEKFPHFAVDFRWKDQDASRARIFSWSGRAPLIRELLLARDGELLLQGFTKEEVNMLIEDVCVT